MFLTAGECIVDQAGVTVINPEGDSATPRLIWFHST